VSGVTGVLTIPGDRSDALIEQFAHTAACGLSQVIVREDLDRRGRAPGEVAALISRVIRTNHPDIPLEIIEDELHAIETAIDRAKPGELIAAFCDRFEEVFDLIEKRGGRPVSDYHPLTRSTGLRAA
jgi:cyanophycin synthetase